MQHRDLYPALVTCLALLVYLWNFVACGRAGADGIAGAATSDHPALARSVRVQQTTADQLILFLPSLWLFCLTLSTLIGAAIGIVFVLGRSIYSATAGGPGFAIAIVANVVLLAGALIGTVRLLVLDL
jgi:glutathione S-transferase